MKKLSTGFAAMTLCLGLAACDNQDERTTEVEDLNRMESPAAGSPPTTTPDQPTGTSPYGTGTSGSTGTGTGTGTMGQPTDDSATMPNTTTPSGTYQEGENVPQ